MSHLVEREEHEAVVAHSQLHGILELVLRSKKMQNERIDKIALDIQRY